MCAKWPIKIFTVSVLPAPDSPDTKMLWHLAKSRKPRYAVADVAYACGGSACRRCSLCCSIKSAV